MGKKLDALLGRNSKTSKFKTTAKLAISRIAILKNQRQVRCSQARSDIIQLLNLGQHESALLRVEHVIREQNMLDAFSMIESYCYLLSERVELIGKNNECPEELKEVISSLIFASSRCGEFPELRQLHGISTSRFGKEFAACAIELRNNCGVNPKMVQKLSARHPSLESRIKALKEIACEKGITLHLEEDSLVIAEEKSEANQEEKQQSEPNTSANLNDTELKHDLHDFSEETELDETFSESMKGRKKYRDVAAAAQAAFESAAYAAAAARAAVELSRSESQDYDPDDQSGSNHRGGTTYDSDGSSTQTLQINRYEASEEIKQSDDRLVFNKIHPIENFSLESEGVEMEENNNTVQVKELEEMKNKDEIDQIQSDSSLDLAGGCVRKLSSKFLSQNELLDRKIVFDESDDEGEEQRGKIPWHRHHNLPLTENQHRRKYNANADENFAAENLTDEDRNMLTYRSPKHVPLEFPADPKIHPMEGSAKLKNAHSLDFVEQVHARRLNADRKLVSMRTRRAHMN